jgi:GT2 family glycosyltransferase
MKGSVVIATCGRPELLGRCLHGLSRQTGLDSFEIIVVDDAGNPPAQAVVDEAVASFPACAGLVCIRLLRNRGPAAARNAGWGKAQYECIAFTDDDTIPEPDWLANGFRALQEGVMAAAGRVVVPLNGSPTDYELNESRLQEAEFVTANCFVRKSVLEDIGGFDERFRMAWREDSDLHFRLMQLAEARQQKVVRAHMATVVHPVRAARRCVSLAQQRKAFFNALLFKKHPRLYRERIQRHPPLIYYAAVGAALFALVALVSGKPAAALWGIAVWLACTILFMSRRLRRTTRRPAHVAEMAVTSMLIPFLSVYWRLRGAVAFRVWFL